MTPTSQNPDPDATEDPQGDFGPGGYVPRKAAARARKIVLREQMGLHWPIAAVVAGVLILAVVIPIVLLGSRQPQPPFVDVGPLAEIDPLGDGRVQVDGREVLVLRGGGVLAAFVDPPPGAGYCPSTRRIESPGGGVWSLGGRALGPVAEGLTQVDAVAYDDHLWVDVSSPTPSADGGGDLFTECH